MPGASASSLALSPCSKASFAARKSASDCALTSGAEMPTAQAIAIHTIARQSARPGRLANEEPVTVISCPAIEAKPLRTSAHRCRMTTPGGVLRGADAKIVPRNQGGSMAQRKAAPLVGLVMGSDSDWDIMRHAARELEAFGIPFEARVVSAHRMPDDMFEYAEDAGPRGIRVLIAGAGGAAHLPGM